jgi:SAM-dependent methyltransferase
MSLHEERLEQVVFLLRQANAGSVLDLGCGAGRLLSLLATDPRVQRLAGVDSDAGALAVCRSSLPVGSDARIRLHSGDYTRPIGGLSGFDAVVMVETIEHLDPGRVSAVEHTVFHHYRPRLALITTPNRDYNPLLGLREGQRRDPDHRFEWDRNRFRSWATGVARRNGYQCRLGGIGEAHPELGSPSQYARFELAQSLSGATS